MACYAGRVQDAVHLSAAELTARLRALPPPRADEGVVALVVVRPEVDARVTPARCKLTPDGGVEGDRWARKENPALAAQVSVMRADVARVVANGQPISLTGDNLLVELDLSPENLPTGTRLRVGTALCEVTDKPHTGCKKFTARFGQDARELTGSDTMRSWRLRGLYLRVLVAGEVGPGDLVRVLERPAAT
jgi:MOSC domain-containing protein YiiM